MTTIDDILNEFKEKSPLIRQSAMSDTDIHIEYMNIINFLKEKLEQQSKVCNCRINYLNSKK